jgi:hypothetical protein
VPARHRPEWLGVAGGLLVALGSVLPWADVRLDLARVFGLFPPDYRQSLGGLELGGAWTLSAGVLAAAAAAATRLRPRLGSAGGTACLIAAAGALMGGLYHAIRIRPLALARVAEVSGRAPETIAGAQVGIGLGPLVVIAGALMALAGGVLLAARGSD